MTKSRSDLRVLLMQIRQETETRIEELESFAQHCQLSTEQFSVLNVFDQPKFDAEVLNGFDALFVGGSSEASVLEPELYPFVIPAQALLRDCIQQKFPVFASCFGHQLAVMALGGEVVTAENDFEMGAIPIKCRTAAKDDLLFGDTPDEFLAISVHRELNTVVPNGCTELAYTDVCCHALTVDGAPFWTTQFHPEVDLDVLIRRLTLFQAKYTESADQLQQVLDTAEETPESNKLLKKFVDRVLLAN